MFDGIKGVAAAAANIGALVEQIDVGQLAALAGSLVQWAERMEAAVGRIEAAIARMEEQQRERTRIVARGFGDDLEPPGSGLPT